MFKKKTVIYFLIPAIVLSLVICIGISIVAVVISNDFHNSELARTSAWRLNNETTIAARDLAEQMAMSQHSYYQLWLSFAALMISSVGMAILLYSLYQTRQAIRDNKNIGIAQSCAFLHADKVEPSDIDIEGYRLLVKNTGSSPALDIHISSFIQSANPPLAERFRFPENSPNNLGAIASGETRPFVIRAPHMEFLAGFGPGQYEIISGTISYSDIFGSRYKSQFAFYRSSRCNEKWLLPAIRLSIHEQVAGN